MMYTFAGRHSGFAESFYLIDRTWLLWHGKIPYQEIEFAYGPGLLYGPLIFKYLLPVDIAQAYYLFWLFNHLLGIWLLFKAVNMIDYPSPSKESIFLLIFFAGLFAILRMGTNYTFLSLLVSHLLRVSDATTLQSRRNDRDSSGRYDLCGICRDTALDLS